MIYETWTDTDPTPRQIEASSSKWAARKWARLYHDGEGRVTVHVHAPGGISVPWSVWPEARRTWRVQVAA